MYELISWPEIQTYMELDGFDENSSLADEEKFGPSAYFVDKDWLDEVDSEMDDVSVEDVVSDCLHTLEDGKEYVFKNPIELSYNLFATKFWVDDGNEDVRVEIRQTYPTDSWSEDAFLSSMDNDDALKVAKEIKKTVWGRK